MSNYANFVEQYTLVNPQNIAYNIKSFRDAKQISLPVECQNMQFGWKKYLSLPKRSYILQYIQQLLQLSKFFETSKEMRTFSIINMTENKRLLILPNLQNMRNPNIWSLDEKKHRKPDWILYMTPEINRAIIRQLRVSREK